MTHFLLVSFLQPHVNNCVLYVPFKCWFFSRLLSFFFLSLCDVISPYNFSFHLLLTVFILALFHILWEDNKFKHLCRLIYLTEKTVATWKLLEFWDIVGLPLRAVSFVFFAVNYSFLFLKQRLRGKVSWPGWVLWTSKHMHPITNYVMYEYLM